MFEPPQHRYRVPMDGNFSVADWPTAPPDDTPGKKELKRRLEDVVDELDDLQRRLYAADRHAVLAVFQAMDAAGKDSTIRAVTRGLNPAGFQVFSFKQPSSEELDHDFLWRTAQRLPERGRIGIFNRSYYEEVLVVRVHPEYLEPQRIPERPDLETLWNDRYRAIASHEEHLARSGTVVLKFWLNVSPDEQARRFLSRLEEPEKNWKFNPGDLKERKRWPDYMRAYQEAINATNRPWAPWYAIPADDKPAMRLAVAEILHATLTGLDPRYPKVDDDVRDGFRDMKRALKKELKG